MHKALMTILPLLLLGLSHSAVGEESTDEFLGRIARAYGGAMTVAQTRAVKVRGTTYSAMRGRSGPIARAYQHPDRLVVEIAYAGQAPERRVIDGEQGWRQGQPVGGPFHGSMVLQAARMALPRILFEHRDVLIDHGRADAPGDEGVRLLEVPLGDGLALHVAVEPGSGYILRSRGVMKMGETSMEFGTGYEDFRMHEGRLVAFREVHFVSGKTTGYTEILDITFPDSLPDSMFAP